MKRHDAYKYDLEYEARPEQKKRRAQRNKDRRAALKSGKVHKGDKMDVHHRDKNDLDDILIINRSKNRSMR